MYVLCLSCCSATFAVQHGGFVPRERLAAGGLFLLGYCRIFETSPRTQRMRLTSSVTQDGVRVYSCQTVVYLSTFIYHYKNSNSRDIYNELCSYKSPGVNRVNVFTSFLLSSY